MPYLYGAASPYYGAYGAYGAYPYAGAYAGYGAAYPYASYAGAYSYPYAGAYYGAGYGYGGYAARGYGYSTVGNAFPCSLLHPGHLDENIVVRDSYLLGWRNLGKGVVYR